jgi:hypothetical protein
MLLPARVAVDLALPIACVWARRQEAIILRTGVGLSPRQLELVARLGIRHAEHVRLKAVNQLPPSNRLLLWIGKQFGFLPTETVGMTLRYGIFIRSDHWINGRLLVHELAHVVQYERLGGFWAFLRQYLNECIRLGYPLGPLEQEAKRAELTVPFSS